MWIKNWQIRQYEKYWQYWPPSANSVKMDVQVNLDSHEFRQLNWLRLWTHPCCKSIFVVVPRILSVRIVLTRFVFTELWNSFDEMNPFLLQARILQTKRSLLLRAIRYYTWKRNQRRRFYIGPLFESRLGAWSASNHCRHARNRPKMFWT